MRQLLLTRDSPVENIALDEALLDAAEAGELGEDILRLWEQTDYTVVLGRSCQEAEEVRLDACKAQQIGVLRRPSGGGTVLAGPGCFMYTLILSLRRYPQLKAVDEAHRFVLEQLAEVFVPLVPSLQRAGISDLAYDPPNQDPLKKCSGNAMRVKRSHVLYHGTLLYNFDLTRIGELLATPPRQPEYRDERTHDDFLANLPVTREEIVQKLIECWNADRPLGDWPQDRLVKLVQEKYTEGSSWVVLPPCVSP